MQMKKAGLFLIFVFILSILAISHVSAEDILPVNDSLIQNIQKGQEKVDQYNSAQSKSDYLMQEWEKFLGNSTIGKIIMKIGEFLKPVLTFLIGTEAGINWKFFIALTIWIAFLVSIGNSLLAFSPFSSSTSVIISLGLTIILAQLKFIDKISTFLDNFISKWWGKLIIIMLIIFLMMIYKMIEKNIKQEKKKEEEEEDKRKLHAEVKKAESFSEGAGI